MLKARNKKHINYFDLPALYFLPLGRNEIILISNIIILKRLYSLYIMSIKMFISKKVKITA